jgi:hypothetical protein
MSDLPYIQYLRHREIDKLKWDDCIKYADNSLIYAHSFYLDQMAKNWDALIFNDYEIVMPLTWNNKFGIHYLYQPFLTAQLGIFGKKITPAIVDLFIQAIPLSYRLIEISLNSENYFGHTQAQILQRSNYVLDLNKPYEELYKNYRENIRRNIKKAMQLGCTAQKEFDVEEVIKLALQQMNNYSKESADNVDRFRKLYNYLEERKMAITYGIYSASRELLASAVFFLSNKRAYYILVGNHPNGKTIGASHALIDAFIKDYAGKDMILDFEGSDIRNLAFFYSSFGAAHEIYPALKINRLPFYLRWMKR